MSITNDFFNTLNDPEAALWSAGVSFNRSNPLPLDKWSVFANESAAVDYIRNNPVAYPGQIIAAYVDKKMQALIIEEKDDQLVLSPIGIIPTGQGPISVSDNGVISLITDDATIKVVDGALTLFGFKDAEEGAQLIKTNNGLEWIKEDNTIIDFSPKLDALEASIENIKIQLGEKKTDEIEASGIYAEIELLEQAIVDADHLRRIKVDSIEDIDLMKKDAHKYIYMVPAKTQDNNDKYDEYMVFDNTLEKVGSWETDLADYVTKIELETEVQRAKKAESDLQTEITDLSEIVTEIEKDIQEKADIVYYTVKDDETGITEKIAGSFLSPTDKEKLDALVLDKNGNVGVSSNVNAENVEGLEEWLTENGAAYISELTDVNLSQDLNNKINFITSVNGKNFLVESGKLELVSVEQFKVGGLEEALAAKAAKSDLQPINKKLTEFDKILNGYVDEQNAPVTGLVESFSKLNSSVGSLDSRINALETYNLKLSDYYVTLSTFSSSVGNLEAAINKNKTDLTSLETLVKDSIVWQDI